MIRVNHDYALGLVFTFVIGNLSCGNVTGVFVQIPLVLPPRIFENKKALQKLENLTERSAASIAFESLGRVFNRSGSCSRSRGRFGKARMTSRASTFSDSLSPKMHSNILL